MLSNKTELESRSIAANVIAALLLLIIMLTSIIGNTAVIFAVMKCHHLKEEISNILTVNLAVTDLGNGIFVMFSAFIALVANDWIIGSIVCDIVCALNYCFMITSMITLCAISADRYQAVMNPFQYKTFTTRTRLTIVALYSWFQGLTFSIVPMAMKWVEYDYWEAICAIDWYKEKQQAIYYVIAAFLMCFLIPGLILTFNYIKMLRAIKNFIQPMPPSNQTNQGNENRQSNQQQKTYNTSSRAIRSLVIVAVAYFVCFTPFSVTKLIKVISDSNDSVPGYINLTSSLIAYCSSAVNPLIYGIFRSDFRLAYKLLINRIVNKFGYDSLFETIGASFNGY